jgi:DNA-directed RNA polymerase specialized sigma subunit
MSVSEVVQEDFDDFDWPEPDAPSRPYVTKAEGKEQARNMYLKELIEMKSAIEGLHKRMPEIVKLAKANGATWEDVGDALGTTRQAVCRRFNGPKA